MNTSFLPPVSSLITLDDLPEQLLFVQDGLSALFDDVYFKDLQFTRSPQGSAAYYALTLVFYKKAGFTVPGAEIDILLNPSFDGTTQTEIPLTLRYDWELLGLIKQVSEFDIESFSASAKAMAEILADLLGMDQTGLAGAAITQFTSATDPIAALNAFVADVNAQFGVNIPNAAGPDFDTSLVEVLDGAAQATGKSIFEVVFETYVEDINLDKALGNVNRLFTDILGGEEPVDYLKSLLIPKVAATLQASLGIAFPRKYLTPLDITTLEPLADTTKHSMLKFASGTVKFDTEAGIGFDQSLTANLNHPSMIGETGLIIDLDNAKLDISRETNIPEADLDGRPAEFVGVFIEEASIQLPPKWFKQPDETTAKIVGRNLLIGTGGLSGILALEAVGGAVNSAITAKLGNNSGFEIGFKSFDITFKQNAVIGSNIEGFLKIRGFKDANDNDAQIDIKATISDNGDFLITASEADGIRLLRIPDILDLEISSLSVGRKDDKFFVAIGGSIDFADQTGGTSGFIANNLPKDIEIQKIVIWEDGRFEFEGGSLELRKPLSMKIGPVDFSVTALHFGSHTQEHNGIERQYNFFGFDGGLSIKPGGVDARGDGIKFYFTVDNGPGKPLHVFIRIQSIAIDLVIPGDASPETAALLLRGYLSMKEPSNPAEAGAGTEYAGGIDFTLPKLKMGGSAAMRYNPKLPAFLIDVGFEIPTPIPLGATGLGLYGFRGLIGSRYVATKQAAGLGEDAKWYEYYKAKISPDYREGIQPSKFEAKPGFSVGAGVSLATSTDSGKVFSSKVFFLLSLPEVFLIEGQGQILKERIGLNSTNDPPFYAFIAITSQSVETALGANYKLPDTGDQRGKLVTVTGVIELAFFFGNSQGWYVNIGRDLPEEKRLRARIFDLFDSYFYMMISSSGIRAGAGVSYNLRKKFGPLRAVLEAYLDVYGEISFVPVQIGGSIQVGGSLSLTLFGVGFSLSASAGLAAEAPEPFIISGQVKACVKVLWTKKCAKFSFTWVIDETLNTDEIALFDQVLARSVQALHMKTLQSFPLLTGTVVGGVIPAPSTATWNRIDDFVIPLDSFIEIEFKQGVKPASNSASMSKIGGLTHAADNAILVPPKKGKSEQVRHEFFIDSLEIKVWNPLASRWDAYDPYDAVTTFDNPQVFTEQPDPSELKAGYWQNDHPKQYNKIRLLSQTPLNYLLSSSGDLRPAETELFNITVEKIFCEDHHRQKNCVAIERIAWEDGQGLYVPADHWISGGDVLLRMGGPQRSNLVSRPFAGFVRALPLQPGQSLEVLLVEASVCVDLRLQSEGDHVRVRYYQRVRSGDRDGNGLPVYNYALVRSRIIGAAELADQIKYEDPTQPVDRVVIEAGPCKVNDDPDGPGEDRPCRQVLTKNGELLEAFLRALAKYGDLWRDKVQIFPKAKARYLGIFLKTALYPKLHERNPCTADIFWEGDKLIIMMRDKKRFECKIQLSIQGLREEIKRGTIATIENLRPNPDAHGEGEVYSFLIDIVVKTDRGLITYTAKGISCYKIADCLPVTKPTDKLFRKRLKNIGTFLTHLISLDKLVQIRRLNLSRGRYADAFAPMADLRHFSSGKQSRSTVYWSERLEKTGLRITVKDEGQFHQRVTLHSGEPVDFDKIKSVSGFRTDPARLADENGYYFLLNAMFNGRRILLRGRSEYEGGDKESPADQQKPKKSHDDLICTPPTKAALQLQEFLNAFFQRGEFDSQSGVLLQQDYDGIFFRTSLYEGPQDVVIFENKRSDKTSILIRLFDEPKDYVCEILLTITGGQFAISQLVKFARIRLDPDGTQEGPNYDFLIDAVVITSSGARAMVTLKGRSCYPISNCRKKTCESFVYQICTLSESDFIYNSTIPTLNEVQNETDALTETLNKTVQPIWRPNSIFAVQVNTSDVVSELAQPYNRSYFFGFKTSGGLGFFHNFLDRNNQWRNRADFQTLVAEDLEDTYQLAHLGHYINFARSYPNADGRLINAKPLFYSDPELLLFFTDDYTHMMFSAWGAYAGNVALDYTLEAQIKDPVDDPAAPSPFIVGAAWERNDVPTVSHDVTTLQNMMQPEGADAPVPCTTTTEIIRFGIHSEYTVPELAPLKAYSAQFYGKFTPPGQGTVTREVHRYVFQTSRYASFAEQIDSFRMRGDDGTVLREAVFDLPVSPSQAELNLARSIVQRTMADSHVLMRDFADPYDRLTAGVLKMTAPAAAVTTEVNVLRSDARVFGLIVHSPEPFNDPKLPEVERANTVTLQVDGGNTALFTAIHSKDLASVLLTNADGSMTMPVGTYRLTFLYKQYDGRNYVTRESVSDVIFELQ